MTKVAKIASLTKHLDNLKNRLTGAVPLKRRGHEEVYYKFINMEINKCQKTIDKLKLESQK